MENPRPELDAELEDKTPAQCRVVVVLDRLRKMALEEEFAAEVIAETLEAHLDDLAGEDFFGTEGQCDPRGDGREGTWTMFHVEGVDG